MSDNGILYDAGGIEYRIVSAGEVGPDAVLVYTQAETDDGDQRDGDLHIAKRAEIKKHEDALEKLREPTC